MTLYPLLLLEREGLTEDGQSAIVDWLGDVKPITITIQIERTAGTDSDQCFVWFTRGSEWHPDPRDLAGIPTDQLNQLLARIDGNAVSFDGVGRTTEQLSAPGPRDQISWDIDGGTWNVSVWLEASPMDGGRLYQHVGSSDGPFAGLL